MGVLQLWISLTPHLQSRSDSFWNNPLPDNWVYGIAVFAILRKVSWATEYITIHSMYKELYEWRDMVKE